MPKTFSVHPNYLEVVQSAWTRKNRGHNRNLAEEFDLSISIVNRFLKGKPVSGLNFLELCQILELDWHEVAGLALQSSQVSVEPEQKIIAQRSPSKVSAVDGAIDALVATLKEMLRRLTRKAGDLLRADRTSIFLLDRQRQQLGTISAEDGGGGSLAIDIPSNRGIASLAATTGQPINIPFDLYADPRSEEAQKTDRRTGYRTYTMLAWPLFNQQKDLVAVVQLINKLKPDADPEVDLSQRIDTQGFTLEDEALFAKFAPSILQILEKCQFCFLLTQKIQSNAPIKRGGVVLPESELIAELRHREQQLHKILERI
jgi:hypothetical protein